MTVSYTFTRHDDYLYVEASGTISSDEEMETHAHCVADEADRQNCSKILIYDRDLSIQLTPFDTISFAERMDEISLALKGLRIAVVVTPHNKESRAFIETALVNRSVQYKAVGSREEGLDWLLQQYRTS